MIIKGGIQTKSLRVKGLFKKDSFSARTIAESFIWIFSFWNNGVHIPHFVNR